MNKLVPYVCHVKAINICLKIAHIFIILLIFVELFTNILIVLMKLEWNLKENPIKIVLMEISVMLLFQQINLESKMKALFYSMNFLKNKMIILIKFQKIKISKKNQKKLHLMYRKMIRTKMNPLGLRLLINLQNLHFNNNLSFEALLKILKISNNNFQIYKMIFLMKLIILIT